MEFDRERDNALRLAAVLARYAEDPTAVRKIAAALNYYPSQLQEDMVSVYSYLKRLDSSKDNQELD